jgi:hypothetical protein
MEDTLAVGSQLSADFDSHCDVALPERSRIER